MYTAEKSLNPKKKNQKFCRIQCAGAVGSNTVKLRAEERSKIRTKKICPECGKEFENKVGVRHQRTYCSPKCGRLSISTKHYEKSRMEYMGKKFGRLTILDIQRGKAGKANKSCLMCDCLCECGRSHRTRLHTILTGQCISCGCAMGRAGLKYVDRVDAAYRYLYRAYRNSAKNRKVDFDIGYSEFVSLVSRNCYYCGCEPRTEIMVTTFGIPAFHYYNGIDRVDNSKPYSLLNAVVSCTECNRAKSSKSESQFLDETIKRYQGWVVSKGGMLPSEFLKNGGYDGI